MIGKNKTVKKAQDYFDVNFIKVRIEQFPSICHIQIC